MNKLISEVKGFAASITVDDSGSRGFHLDLRAEFTGLKDCARILLEHGFYLSFITAVHVRPAAEVMYKFAHYEIPYNIIIRVSAGEDMRVPSIIDIYQGAAWHEREMHDFFGITFDGHRNLKHLILSREEKGLNPLIKSEKSLKSHEEIFPPKGTA